MRGTISAFDLEDALAELQALGSDVAGEVLADALNHTGNQARQLLRAGMDEAFDRPTAWVKNSIYMQNATPSNPVVALWVKDGKLGGKGRGFDEWFNPQVAGGERLNKGSEKMLREIGVLPAGRFIVPAAGARLDSNGGISRGHMMQILSGLRAFGRAGADHNATGSRRSTRKGHGSAFFVMKRGRTAIGIAERRGQQVQMVLAFVRQPQYRERFRFYDIVRRVAEDDARIETNIDLAVVKALGRRRGRGR
ncbi:MULTISPECIES: hypothetical protein [unclassified Pseudomonas]|uniref:hypothetical protein n=1 Tax=unclassified Pseudomonas TaxID=196821 RepID=UPI002448154F|nr:MULTISPECIES: hypothetical protein [unclassified Pseudomonas]MDG9926128.1 hypothetical protein [Pseudomonas sp. GD04045]MDH0037472.1 hypothetical protein [Pseudomonas sp. GD04019]